jgi:outer membrane protein
MFQVTFLGVTIASLLLSTTVGSNAQPAPKPTPKPSKSLAASPSTSIPTVQLSLNDAVKLVTQGNRDLKNATLDRIVQKQELKEAESKFKPTFTPNLSLGINHQFQSANGLSAGDGFLGSNSVGTGSTSGASANSTTPSTGSSSGTNSTGGTGSSSGTNSIGGTDSSSGTNSIGGTDSSSGTNSIGSTGSANSLQLGDSSELSYGAQLSMNWLSPIGTRLSMTALPLSPQSIDVTITQPLLRGAGTRVNRASVKTARIGEQRNVLTLQQTVIDKLTETVIAYRTLIKTQEEVRIQELALQSKQRQLEGTQALVDAGRKPQSEIIQTQKSISDTEQSLVLAKNNYAQANSDLLKLIESDRAFMIVIPQADIDALRRSQLPQVKNSFNELLFLAYKTRADYQQAKLNIDSEKLGLMLAKDNQRWSLDLQSSANLSESSQVSAGLVFSRTLGEQSPKTERIRREIEVQKNQNKLAQLTNNVRQEVNDRLRDVNSAQVQVATSQRGREYAQQQLEVAQTLFRRRGGQVTLFEIIQKQDDLIAAQNEEVQAKIEYLNAITNLEKAVGLTLDTWKDLIAANPSLNQ